MASGGCRVAGLLEPVPQRALRDPKRTGHLRDRPSGRLDNTKHVPTELIRDISLDDP